MKRLAHFILFLFTLQLLTGFGQAAEPASATPPGLSVVTWNIEWYPGKNRFARSEERRAHAALVQAELKKLDPIFSSPRKCATGSRLRS